jgi:flagella basal body P-ring formation protein FlgA
MSWILRSLALVCSLHAATAWSAGAAVTVSLGESVLVEREQLKLGDIAQIQGAEPWQSRLRELKLGAAPRAGLTRRLDREALVALVRERHGRLVPVAWDGAGSVLVKRASIDYAADTFVKPAQERLLRTLQERHGNATRIDAVSVGVSKPLALPNGNLTVAARQIRADVSAKRVCVWVDVAVDGVAVTSLPIWFSVSIYEPTLVAARGIARHERLGDIDMKVEERDIAGLSARPLAAQRSADALRARHPLAQGQVVLKTDVEPAPSVLRNQEIQVQVHSGGVVIETSGIAMQEGHIGDRVSVRNPGSQKDYVARVISEGVVRVSTQ